jgi:hypothetical protein
MCEVRSKEKTTEKNPKKKLQWSATKKMDYDELHLTWNEKMQPI